MLAMIAILTALTVGLFALTLIQLRPGSSGGDRPARPDAPRRSARDSSPRRRQAKSERLMSILQALGQRVGERPERHDRGPRSS